MNAPELSKVESSTARERIQRVTDENKPVRFYNKKSRLVFHPIFVV